MIQSVIVSVIQSPIVNPLSAFMPSNLIIDGMIVLIDGLPVTIG